MWRGAGRQHGSSITDYCEEAGQTGAGTKAGGQKLVTYTGLAMQKCPNHVFVSEDEINAFNECERATMVNIVRNEPTLRVWAKAFNSHMAPAGPIYRRDPGGGLVRLAYDSVTGGQQGSYEGGAGYNLCTVAPLRWLRDRLRASGGNAGMGADDGVFHGPPEHLWPALTEYRQRKEAHTGNRFNDAKAKCHSPSGLYGNRPEFYQVAEATTQDGVVGRGLKVWGCAQGDMAFVRANVEQKGERVQSLINKISTRLGPTNPDCLMQVLILSSNHLFDWVAQMHPPEATVPVAIKVDSAIRSAVSLAAGVDLLDPEAAYSPGQLPAPGFAADRTRLPIRHRGTGLRSVADMAPVAFLGGLNMTLSGMINRAGPGGSMVPGLFHTPAMVEVLGEGSFDAGGDGARFEAFEESGLPMAQQASASWTLEQLEGLLDDGPLTRPFNTMGGGGEKLQRAITKQKEDYRAALLGEVANLLPKRDPRKVAYQSWTPTSGALWCPPTPETTIPPELYGLGVSTWMGVEVGSLRGLVGRPIGRGRKCLDRFGMNLGLADCCKAAWTRAHHGMVATVAQDLTKMGVEVLTEVPNLFTSVIPEAARVRLAGQTPQAVSGLVPDAALRGFTGDSPLATASWQLVEVKTIHVSTSSQSWYQRLAGAGGGLKRAVEVRAAAVPGEYRRKAKNADAKYCDVPLGGPPGPILRRLNELSEVLPLVFGSLGDTSASVTKLAKAAAMEGARRRQCRVSFNTKGDDVGQAAALMSWWMRRRWGRLAILRALMVKESALREVTGSRQSRGRAGPEADAGVAHEYWAQQETRRDGGPTFGGFDAGFGPRA